MIRINPFNLLVLLIFILTLAACSSTKNVSNQPTAAQDGLTKETAIPVKSIDSEYEWIKVNYPGSKVISQELLSGNKKYYDLLTFVTSSGETKKVYFDITSFFGKF